MIRRKKDILFVFIGKLLSYFIPPTISQAFKMVRDKLYTGYICRRFAYMGQSYFIWHPYNLKGTKYITIGDGNVFESGIQLTAWEDGIHHPQITIGNHCLIRRDTHITACNNITIGDHLLTGTNVLITDNSHGDGDFDTLHIPPTQRITYSKGPVRIGNNVWLGNNVCVMPNVTIGDGVVIGANSVVTHDIPAFCVAAGIPARIIKQNNK